MQASDDRHDRSSAHALDPAAASATPAWVELHERERARLGFDLHDGPVQTMAAALLQLRMLHDLSQCVCDEECSASVAELETTLSDALDQMYSVIEDLHGCALSAEGLIAPLRAHAESFSARSGLNVTISFEGDEVPVSQSLRIAVFRIMQEALSNTWRHAGAHAAHVQLVITPAEVVCEITDDGCGFDPLAAPDALGRRGRFGLTGMRERARLLDGSVEVVSAPGSGTTVRARIPVWQA